MRLTVWESYYLSITLEPPVCFSRQRRWLVHSYYMLQLTHHLTLSPSLHLCLPPSLPSPVSVRYRLRPRVIEEDWAGLSIPTPESNADVELFDIWFCRPYGVRIKWSEKCLWCQEQSDLELLWVLSLDRFLTFCHNVECVDVAGANWSDYGLKMDLLPEWSWLEQGLSVLSIYCIFHSIGLTCCLTSLFLSMTVWSIRTLKFLR